MSRENPYEKTVHMAKLVNENGGASPWCAKRPGPIDLKRAVWTIVEKHVTCPRCRAALRKARKS